MGKSPTTLYPTKQTVNAKNVQKYNGFRLSVSTRNPANGRATAAGNVSPTPRHSTATGDLAAAVRVKRATYNQMLRDLGFRVNPEKVETSIGKNEVTVEESGTNDPAADFVRKTLEGLS